MLDARARPFQRPVEALRQLGDGDLFRIELVFDAEAAADIGGDHTQHILRQAQDGRQSRTDAVRDLCAGPECQPAGDGIGRGSHRPHFHGHAGDALAEHALAERVRRGSEDLIDIVRFLLAGINDIALQAVEDLGRVALASAEQIDRGRQFFPLDSDLIDRVFRHFG